ncbi:hypothetical protein GOBAR_AA27794 [Gossypium barbadense]|uniref:Uncharacterized protein n=1 Tax=Gossypium barbadense TaxID=3634 RepID=A0A2P5WP52_GOSBA|nr:hypothetical protein GOBAR_AA27794 [Gossypium barbadense]
MEKMINKRTYNHSVAFWDPRTPTTSVGRGRGDDFGPRRSDVQACHVVTKPSVRAEPFGVGGARHKHGGRGHGA